MAMLAGRVVPRNPPPPLPPPIHQIQYSPPTTKPIHLNQSPALLSTTHPNSNFETRRRTRTGRRWRRWRAGWRRQSQARWRPPHPTTPTPTTHPPRFDHHQWSTTTTTHPPQFNHHQGCLVQVGNGIKLEAVGLQFEPYRWRPCCVTWDSSRTVVVITLRRTFALTTTHPPEDHLNSST